MAKRESKIVIVDCCGERFSKVVDFWPSKPVIGEEVLLELFPGQGWQVLVTNIFPPKSDTNPYELDAVFMTSENKALFSCLCDCIEEKGWFENEEACAELPRD